MILAGDRRDKLQRITRNPTRNALGTTYTETLGGWLWANVLELPPKTKLKYQSIYAEATHRICFHGRPAVDFAKTEFQWGMVRLQPIAHSGNPGPSSTWHTELFCRDVTSRRTDDGS